jgi:hypothetical protein
MKKKALLCVLLCVASTTCNAADSSSCDDALVQQTSVNNESERMTFSYLSLVSKENYETAKKGASAALGNLFSGSYSDFEKKRSSLFEKQGYAATHDQAREEFKSYLSETQLAGWLECKTKLAPEQLIVYYKNVDPESATLVIRWQSGAAGPLKDINVAVDPSEAEPDNLKALTTLAGQFETPIRRAKVGAAVRGSIVGTAGINLTTFSESFYIPPLVTEAKKEVIPTMYRVPLDGEVRASIAYWAHGHAHQRFECLPTIENMQLIVISEHEKNLGNTRNFSRCLGPASGGTFCDSGGEGCADVIIDKGCWINKDWLSWYQLTQSNLGLPYSQNAVCGY